MSKIKELRDKVNYLEKRIDDIEKIGIWIKSGKIEIEERIDTHYLIKMIMDYLGITIRDRDKYEIVNKEKKDK